MTKGARLICCLPFVMAICCILWAISGAFARLGWIVAFSGWWLVGMALLSIIKRKS